MVHINISLALHIIEASFDQTRTYKRKLDHLSWALTLMSCHFIQIQKGLYWQKAPSRQHVLSGWWVSLGVTALAPGHWAHHRQYLATMCHPDNWTHSIWIMTKIRSIFVNCSEEEYLKYCCWELRGEKRRMSTISSSLIWGQTLLCHPTENWKQRLLVEIPALSPTLCLSSI